MVAATQLEMQLRLGDTAGGADTCDHLAAGDLFAAFDQHHIAMRIGRDPTVRVFDQNEVTVTPQLVSGIGLSKKVPMPVSKPRPLKLIA